MQSPKIIGLVLVVVVLGGGIWYFTSHKNVAAPASQSTADTSQTQSVSDTQAATPTNVTNSTTMDMTLDPDISNLVTTLTAMKTMADNKDIDGILATQTQIFPPDYIANIKQSFTDPKMADFSWAALDEVFANIPYSTLDTSMTCKFYEKTPGKSYDRAAICHVPITIPAHDSNGNPIDISAGTYDLKLSFTKLDGVWYMKIPEGLSDMTQK